MRAATIIARRELGALLRSARAYVITAVFLLASGIGFYTYLVQTAFTYTSIEGFVQTARYLTIIFAAILTMSIFADERRGGTYELLLTAPVTDAEIVLGKFLAGFCIYAGMLALTFYYPLLLVLFGDPDFGPIITSYLGLLLLGAVCLSVGVFSAAISGNQLVASVVCLAILFALLCVGAAGGSVHPALGRILDGMSLTSHFSGFSRGVIDSADVIYHLTLSGGFLYLASDSVNGERWQ